MRIVSWNVNGIRSVLRKGFLEWVRSEAPDILCLQEVRAEDEQIPDEVRNFEGYQCFWLPASKKGYSGVSVWTRLSPDEALPGMGIQEFDDEGRMLQLLFPGWVLNCVYFPNGTADDTRLDYKLRFYDAFLENSNTWIRRGRGVVTLGDYNTCHRPIDIARPRENENRSGFLPIERAWIDKYIDSGYVDAFRHLYPDRKDCYTWWSNRAGSRERNVGWRIDYAFVDRSLASKIRDMEHLTTVDGSDHCPIRLTIDL